MMAWADEIITQKLPLHIDKVVIYPDEMPMSTLQFTERLGYRQEKAIQMLKSRLYQLEVEKRDAEKAEIESTKKKIDFGSQIRNYVLHPYKLVKDNRTGVEKTDVQRVLDGDLDDFIKAFLMSQ